MTAPHRGSLAHRTELELRRHEGSEVTVHAGCTAVCTPDLPDFWWGNFLLMPRPPGVRDVQTWPAQFTRTFPVARHMAFGVDTTDGDIGEAAALEALGFEVIRYNVLTCPATRPHARLDAAHQLRPLTTDLVWQAMTHFQVDMITAEQGAAPSTDQQVFLQSRARRLRALQLGRHGTVYGAFDGQGRMLAGLGIYAGGSGLARYQGVETLPQARRRGLASALVHAAGEWARRELGAHTLVIAADPNDEAQRLYERLGFEVTERQVGFLRRPAPLEPSREARD